MGSILIFFLIYLQMHVLHGKTYFEQLKNRFEASFQDRCHNYPFVNQYLKRLADPGDRFVVFVWQEAGLQTGGLGDRLAGLITAATMALRFNRTLLIESNTGSFGTMFQPYQINHAEPQYTYDWGAGGLAWDSYKKISSNDTYLIDKTCISCMPKSRRRIPLHKRCTDRCGLENGDVSQAVIKIYSNRAFLCKWVLNAKKIASKQVTSLLGISPQGNILEAAGCILRLFIWPTNLLWRYIATELQKQTSLHQEYPENTDTNSPAGIQVGVHYRCGDTSYMFENNNTTCDVSHTAGSPQDIANCANEVLNSQLSSFNPISRSPQLHTNSALNVLFISSDHEKSVLLINKAIAAPSTIISPRGCHVDLNPLGDCSLITVGYWVILATSHVIVTQTLRNNFWAPGFWGSPYSAFSRYAGVYGLQGNSFRDATNCSRVVPFTEMGRLMMGNWYCS